ncbi:hypothetical protein M9H77_01830 [Catharanthus roseus]|uniref:Uncharacterized protein n=1 Tax=Catharanthus roseus TaxID=4058 RepID=A0ACC0C6L4_CATRO|nr:hypothetical protein M9H77_01830 [Catharanthus roseus]
MAVATMFTGTIRRHRHVSHAAVNSFSSAFFIQSIKVSSLRQPLTSFRQRFCSLAASANSAIDGCSRQFTWDEVFRSCDSIQNDSVDLEGYFDKIRLCNRNSEKKCEFMPFVIEDQIVGYVHSRFADHLRRFKDIFVFQKDNNFGGNFRYHISLHSELRTVADRTRAVADVVKSLGEELIPGIRNELYPVTSSHGGPVFFSLERAAAPYFGIKAFGVHMNGYLEQEGQKYLWVGKRSKVKPTYPGMLDHLVAGGLPHGISCEENIVKECEEEAAIPSSISRKAVPVGAVSYMDINGQRFKRDVLFCYDLKLPKDFVPKNEDGEVESFKLVPVTDVAKIIRSTDFYKANCNLVVIDFLFRHGYAILYRICLALSFFSFQLWEPRNSHFTHNHYILFQKSENYAVTDAC